ncbi:MAG: ATP-binding protein [Rhodothermales bacterium]
MNRDDVRSFVDTLHEPAAVLTSRGRFLVVNDAFQSVLRDVDCPGAERLHDAVADEEDDVASFLAQAARSRPSIQCGLTLGSAAVGQRMTCFGGRLDPGDEEHEPHILLRCYRSNESVRQFQLLSRKIDELNAEIRRRQGVERDLRDIRSELERRVEKRTSELKRVNIDLVQRNKSLEEFASVASHDLREPLRKITVFGGMLEDELGPELSDHHRSMLERMITAATRMKTLIRGLLAYSRLSTSDYSFETVDLSKVVDDVLVDLEIAVARAGAVIEVDALPHLEADATQMRQLFQNLISNSLKFRRPDVSPRVEISCMMDREGKQIEIAVSDNGIGFESTYAEQIFEPFRRLNPQHEFEGSGIGLAMCRRIVERHGGTISATSTPGEGTTFHMMLPLEASD